MEILRFERTLDGVLGILFDRLPFAPGQNRKTDRQNEHQRRLLADERTNMHDGGFSFGGLLVYWFEIVCF